jgi:clan AA aspartic protease (TIGR02281 family)
MHDLPRPPLAIRPPTQETSPRLRRALQHVPLALSFVLFSHPGVRAEIYQWVDGSGSVHFTDNLLNVPPEFRNQLRTRSDVPSDVGERGGQTTPQTEVPLERRNMGYVVQARINGRETCSLVVDTGATSTVISPRLAERLGIPVQREPGVSLQTVNGEVRAGWAELETLDVGGNTVGPLGVVVHDAVPGADGLLGMNFLRAFRVEILSEGPSLRLKRP